MATKALITGASSGIGQALAGELAARGYDLALSGRRVEALAAVRETIRRTHPERHVETFPLDVTKVADVPALVDAAAAALDGLDLVVANAGIGGPPRRVGEGDFAHEVQVIETNVLGAMATIDAAVAHFRRQGHGHVVVISSVAAVRGLPGAATYSASKAAIAVYADALRAEVHGTAIRVTTLYPGFIDTPLNQDSSRRPFLIPVDKGARLIADLIEKGVGQSTVPVWPWNAIVPLLKHLPTALLARGGVSLGD